MQEFVSVRQGDQIVSVTKTRAETLGLDVVADERAADRAGRPLPPRAAQKPTETTVEAVLDSVGDDPVKAAAALANEQARSKPRTTLVQRLTTITEGGPQ